MEKVKFNIYYGEKEIEQILDEIINNKIIEVTTNIKRGKLVRYIEAKENVSTNCDKKQEVLNN